MTSFILNEIRGICKLKGSIIRCNKGRENIKFQKDAAKQGLGITFEFTSRNTPQQNGVVERSFATLWGIVQAMLRRCGLNKRKQLKKKIVGRICKSCHTTHQHSC